MFGYLCGWRYRIAGEEIKARIESSFDTSLVALKESYILLLFIALLLIQNDLDGKIRTSDFT